MHELSHAERVADEFVVNAATRFNMVLEQKETVLLRRIVLGIFGQNIVAFRPQAVADVNIPADPAELCSWAKIEDHLFGIGLMQIRELIKIAHLGLERQQDMQKVLALIFHAVRV